MQTIITTGFSTSNKLKYLPDNSVILDMPFILTEHRRLIIGMPYLKYENWLADSKIQAVRLLKVWDTKNIAYLQIRDLKSTKADILSYNLEYIGDYWLWSLSSLEYLTKNL
ncbi:MAG: hypothetical protein JXB49_29635 [Bacteroidales bacterium]|nr:hypothetical protein [Bacteroidales bacterium]